MTNVPPNLEYCFENKTLNKSNSNRRNNYKRHLFLIYKFQYFGVNPCKNTNIGHDWVYSFQQHATSLVFASCNSWPFHKRAQITLLNCLI